MTVCTYVSRHRGTGPYTSHATPTRCEDSGEVGRNSEAQGGGPEEGHSAGGHSSKDMPTWQSTAW